MNTATPLQKIRKALCALLVIILLLPAARLAALAQEAKQPDADAEGESVTGFRLERLPVAEGAELLTIFGKLGSDNGGEEAPLLSVLRDTLGDEERENDLLRYVWTFSYTRPTLTQRAAAAVPFLYNRVGNKKSAGKDAPPPLLDLAASRQAVWNKLFWNALQNVLFDSGGFAVKASSRAYRRNHSDYRKAHIVRALAILSLYQSETGAEPVFTDVEKREIGARLLLTDKALGGYVDDIYLERYYQKQSSETLDVRGHNWELLRQRAEAEKLYFEPLALPDGSATHALLWVARSDLERYRGRRFNGRFLNIANPWRDGRLRKWKGYVETRHFDAESRPVPPATPGAQAVELIPLAIYGLDHPKIPILLVDFRDALNPKKREASRRATEDVARNVLLLSRFGDLYYFLGRAVYDFVTDRRGVDINQPSRFRAYSQLKLLLSLSEGIAPQLREDVGERLERVSLNPLENDTEAEVKLARAQYEALMEYARRPDGLAAQIERDRGAEMVKLAHGRAARVFLRAANILSFGFYTHREEVTPELRARLGLNRALAHHRRFLREVVKSTPQIEVVWNVDEVRRSLQFIADHAAEVDGDTAQLAARVFAATEDDAARRLALDCLYRINSKRAKRELVKVYMDERLEARWRELSAEYLRLAVREQQRISSSDVKAISLTIGH
ncbi:MAG TPA: hypothetical protein VNO70_24660 [Blastocatellia bacterium]|nr:hypothetical protein [Blastocatellia bacterium]